MSLLARKAIVAVTCAPTVAACLDSTEPDDNRLTQDEATGRLPGLEGRTGTSAFDLTLSGEPDFSGTQPLFSASYTGTLCAYNVDIDATNLVVPPG